MARTRQVRAPLVPSRPPSRPDPEQPAAGDDGAVPPGTEPASTAGTRSAGSGDRPAGDHRADGSTGPGESSVAEDRGSGDRATASTGSAEPPVPDDRSPGAVDATGAAVSAAGTGHTGRPVPRPSPVPRPLARHAGGGELPEPRRPYGPAHGPAGGDTPEPRRPRGPGVPSAPRARVAPVAPEGPVPRTAKGLPARPVPPFRPGPGGPGGPIGPGRSGGPPGPVPAGRRGGPLRAAAVALRRRHRRVVGLSLAAAVAAAGLALLFPAPTVATTSVQVGAVGTADPGPATARALGAASSDAFTDRVAQLAGTTPADVAARLTVTAPTPGVVDVRAAGTDAAGSSALAGDAVTALGEQVGALDAAVSRAGGGQPGEATVVVPGPEPVVAPEVAIGWWVGGAAVLAALAVPVVVAIAVPAVRRARGLLPEASPADRLRPVLGLPVLEPGYAPDAVPLLASAYRSLLRGAPVLTVVQLTGEPACDVGSELVKAAALVGDRREYTDLTPGATPVRVDPAVPVIRALRVHRISHEDLRLVREGGPTVLAVQTAGTRASDVVTVMEALRAVGAPPVLCLVWPGRLPRDPARVPLPADVRTWSERP
ncbi:hypothetical protein WIS52_06295 [Pseudonocardia nematodicida]|uniref:Capsular polysaccharide biosynthesis protein n=1 Tax=Pseudonocardia nematodicida TaxID=1206997 RepID=A0ABV1K6G8_9PSEU